MTIRALLGPTLVCAALLTAVSTLAPPVSAQNVKEKFTGFAINMNSGPKTAVLDFEISRWSTDEERAQLLAIVKENKNPTDKLLRALQKLPEGRLHPDSSSRWPGIFTTRVRPRSTRADARSCWRPTGRSDFWEARNQPRSIDYPFTILEMHLDKNDEGSGKILVGTKIYIDKKTNNLVLENYAQQPVMFNEIKKLK